MNSTKATERLDFRVNPDHKALFKQAAEKLGVSLSSFVVSALVEQAQKVIYEENILRLSAEDSQAFAEAILHPSEPNTALRDAAKLHNEIVEPS